MDTNQEIEILKRKVAELEKWKTEREKQQIAYPFDYQSIEILNEHFMRIISEYSWQGGAGANTFRSYLGKQNQTIFEVNPPSLVTYTVDVTSNYLTTSQFSGNLKFWDNDQVILYTDGTAPNPLSAGLGTVYHVINSDGYTFQLSLTSGGAAIDITNNGTGMQFINYN